MIDSDMLDLVAARLRRFRQPVDGEWRELLQVTVVAHSAYLESDAWRRKRRQLPEDLAVLCRDCHRLFDGTRAS